MRLKIFGFIKYEFVSALTEFDCIWKVWLVKPRYLNMIYVDNLIENNKAIKIDCCHGKHLAKYLFDTNRYI